MPKSSQREVSSSRANNEVRNFFDSPSSSERNLDILAQLSLDTRRRMPLGVAEPAKRQDALAQEREGLDQQAQANMEAIRSNMRNAIIATGEKAMLEYEQERRARQAQLSQSTRHPAWESIRRQNALTEERKMLGRHLQQNWEAIERNQGQLERINEQRGRLLQEQRGLDRLAQGIQNAIERNQRKLEDINGQNSLLMQRREEIEQIQKRLNDAIKLNESNSRQLQ